MKIFSDTDPVDFPNGSVVTIGAYDGVHRGHRYLLEETVAIAGEMKASSVVVTFDRHPASVVRPGSAPLLLCNQDQKFACLAQSGVDYVCVVEFNELRAQESAVEFVEEFLVDRLNVKMVVVGSDFHFGYRRKGNVALLESLGEKHGFKVKGAELRVSSENVAEAISSTRIRRLISVGDLDTAADYLGRRFQIWGTVSRGDGRGGSELGFPTANILVDSTIATPPDGVYAGWIELPGGDTHPAAISLGDRPTYYHVDGVRVLEVHVLNFDDDLYGADVKVTFGGKIRDQTRFESTDELKEKILLDVSETAHFCAMNSL